MVLKPLSYVVLPGFRWGRTAHAVFREIYLVDSEEDRTAGQARSELLQKPGAGN